MEYFWIIFLLFSIQPWLRQRLLIYFRQSLIERIEKQRNSRVIILIHRQETMSFFGFPVYRFLTMEDAEALLRALHATPQEKDIDLILHTPGGLVLAAAQIARAIKQRKGKTRVIVPHYAMSGGTLIALAADEIIMAPNAVLGPLDPQLGQFPAPSLLAVKKQKDINKIEDKTLVMADMAEKAIAQMQELIIELLMDKNWTKEKAQNLAQLLTEGHWTHDYPLTAQKAQALGLNVNTEFSPIFHQLMSYYKQPTQRQPSVEYLQNENKIF